MSNKAPWRSFFQFFCRLFILFGFWGPFNSAHASYQLQCSELRDFIEKKTWAQLPLESEVEFIERALSDYVRARDVMKTGSLKKKRQACFQSRESLLWEILRQPREKARMNSAELQFMFGRIYLQFGEKVLARKHLSFAHSRAPDNLLIVFTQYRQAFEDNARSSQLQYLETIREIFRKRYATVKSKENFELSNQDKRIFEESFLRLTQLLKRSEALELIEGEWNQLNRFSPQRVKRAIDMLFYAGEGERILEFIAIGWGRGDISQAPLWVHLRKVQAHEFLKDEESSLRAFRVFLDSLGALEQWHENWALIQKYCDRAERLRRFEVLQECASVMKDKFKMTAKYRVIVERWHETLWAEGPLPSVRAIETLEKEYTENLEGSRIGLRIAFLLLNLDEKNLPGAAYLKQGRHKFVWNYLEPLFFKQGTVAGANALASISEWQRGRSSEAKNYWEKSVEALSGGESLGFVSGKTIFMTHSKRMFMDRANEKWARKGSKYAVVVAGLYRKL